MARIEREFFKLVDLTVVAGKVELSPEIVDFVYRYWILKRRAGNNKPLLPPRGEEESLSGLKTEDTERDKMKMLVGIRQVGQSAKIWYFAILTWQACGSGSAFISFLDLDPGGKMWEKNWKNAGQLVVIVNLFLKNK